MWGCFGLLVHWEIPKNHFELNKHIGEFKIQQLKDIFQCFLVLQRACGDVYNVPKPCT